MKLGIDLHNLRDGGGVNYIANLLRVFDPRRHGFDEIHLFGWDKVMARMPDRPDVFKHAHPLLARSLPWRLWFMAVHLPDELRKQGCDMLYSPGGLFLGGFRPFATISRNMVPYEPQRWRMYPAFSFDRLRLVLMRRAHTATFRRADGMIFLTDIARRVVGTAMGRSHGERTVIAHGVDHALFNRQGRRALPARVDPKAPLRLVYPSRLEPYKHQVQVIEAVASLRAEFPQLSLEMCGPANPAYALQVRAAMQRHDAAGVFIRYLGELPNAQLPELYEDAQLLLFASSCENLPNTLIEAMAFGIPTVSSELPPMPEVAGEACLYFDPMRPQAIADTIRQALMNWDATLERVRAGEARAARHSWNLCADQTFAFLLRHAVHAAQPASLQNALK